MAANGGQNTVSSVVPNASVLGSALDGTHMDNSDPSAPVISDAEYAANNQPFDLCCPDSVCCPYEVGSTEMNCDELDCLCCGTPKICIPFNVKDIIQPGMIGIDFCMGFDASMLTPTGNVTIGDVVLNGSTLANYAFNYTSWVNPNELNVSIYYESSAPITAEFIGSGEIACVEFELKPQYTPGTILDFSVCEVVEGFQTSVEFECGDNGTFTLLEDDTLTGKVIYWEDHSKPLRYNTSSPSDYLVTNISGADQSCATLNANVTSTDIDGYFDYNINNGPSVQITRDIDGSFGSTSPCPAPSGSIMAVINGMDAYWTSLVTTLNPTFIPNPYQLIAMDVNMDSVVSANDITHIQNRTIENICEFPQAWNYLPGITPTQNSLDWRFIDSTGANSDPNYIVSNVYPSNDGVGYSRYNVPNVPFCLEIETDDNGGYCTIIPDQSYYGILLGDANGSWDAIGSTGNAVNTKSNDEIIYALEEATKDDNCVISIPVYYANNANLMALDFAMDYDETRLTFEQIVVNSPAASAMSIGYNNSNNERLLFTSYSQTAGGIAIVDPVYFIQFTSIDDEIHPNDLGTISSYFNGVSTNSAINGPTVQCSAMQVTSIDEMKEAIVNISPNPFGDELRIELGSSEKSSIQVELVDMQGKVLLSGVYTSEQVISLQTGKIAKGLYVLRLDGIAQRRVVKF